VLLSDLIMWLPLTWKNLGKLAGQKVKRGNGAQKAKFFFSPSGPQDGSDLPLQCPLLRCVPVCYSAFAGIHCTCPQGMAG